MRSVTSTTAGFMACSTVRWIDRDRATRARAQRRSTSTRFGVARRGSARRGTSLSRLHPQPGERRCALERTGARRCASWRAAVAAPCSRPRDARPWPRCVTVALVALRRLGELRELGRRRARSSSSRSRPRSTTWFGARCRPRPRCGATPAAAVIAAEAACVASASDRRRRRAVPCGARWRARFLQWRSPPALPPRPWPAVREELRVGGGWRSSMAFSSLGATDSSWR